MIQHERKIRETLTRDVGHVGQQEGLVLVADGPHALVVNVPMEKRRVTYNDLKVGRLW